MPRQSISQSSSREAAAVTEAWQRVRAGASGSRRAASDAQARSHNENDGRFRFWKIGFCSQRAARMGLDGDEIAVIDDELIAQVRHPSSWLGELGETFGTTSDRSTVHGELPHETIAGAPERRRREQLATRAVVRGARTHASAVTSDHVDTSIWSLVCLWRRRARRIATVSRARIPRH